MHVYVLVERAIYRHNIPSVASSLPLAIELAKEALRQEKDDHHSIEIVELTMDRLADYTIGSEQGTSSHCCDGRLRAIVSRSLGRNKVRSNAGNNPSIDFTVEGV